MKIYSADTWTIEELRSRSTTPAAAACVVPAADNKRAVLETFGEVLDFPEHYGVDLDALTIPCTTSRTPSTDDGDAPVTVLWQVPPRFRGDRSFGIICEILQDAESYAGSDLEVIAVSSRELARYAVTVRPRCGQALTIRPSSAFDASASCRGSTRTV